MIETINTCGHNWDIWIVTNYLRYHFGKGNKCTVIFGDVKSPKLYCKKNIQLKSEARCSFATDIFTIELNYVFQIKKGTLIICDSTNAAVYVQTQPAM